MLGIRKIGPKPSKSKHTVDSAVHRQSHPLLYSLIGIYAALSILGLVNLYSASLGGNYFYSQLQHSAIAILVFIAVGWLIPLRWLNDYAFWIYGLVVLALAIVLIFGHSAGGSQRWLRLGPITGQPSEFAKIAVLIIVARYFHYQTQPYEYRLRDLWQVAALVLVVFLLIFLQPDLGTAGVCLLIATAQILMLRINLKSLGIVTGSFGVIAILSWFVLLRDYQKVRILTVFNPEIDPTGRGYNSLQSLIAVGSGQVFGKGLMQGTQTQLQFLPARHTDFVFSVFAEEHGFWIGLALFAGFGFLTHICLEISRLGRDTFTNLLGVGVAAYIFVQFAINVAMVLGMFPVVGMPLPFFSHGGSSLISMSIAMGALVAIYRGRYNISGAF